jgi:adenylate cyclase
MTRLASPPAANHSRVAIGRLTLDDLVVFDSEPGHTTPSARLTGEELADLVGDPIERVRELTALGVIQPDDADRYSPGDAHRIRVVDGFEAAGVPLDVLVRAQAAGVISVDYYDQLHAAPGRPSDRGYQVFKNDLGPAGHLLPAMFAAFGIAEPDPASHLSLEDEVFIGDWATVIDATGHADLTLGILRQFGESGRRSSVAALEAYAQVTERLGPEFAGVPSQEIYDRVFVPWAKAARNLPTLAEWLTRHHMSRAIDDYSIRATEQVLADSGYVPERPTVEPAVAFLDLTGFTSLTQERGDTIAAEMALRLADLASQAVATHRGRVVKLLGDGVLMHFPDVVEAVEAALDLMDRLAASDLPLGHVGITRGPIVARDGDIFGRTVNLAARISDVTPSGELYIPASIGHALTGRFVVTPAGTATLQGVGAIDLAAVRRQERATK